MSAAGGTEPPPHSKENAGNEKTQAGCANVPATETDIMTTWCSPRHPDIRHAEGDEEI